MLSHLADKIPTVNILQRSLQKEKTHHAYLFCGPEPETLKQTALATFAALNCSNKGPVDACQQCHNCQSILLPDRHYSELLQIPTPVQNTTAESSTTTQKISVKDVRTIEASISHYATLGKYKGVIIYDAQDLTIQAQNALLKVLEEPPAGAIFFLLALNLNAILLTIRSRCHIIRFPAKELLLEDLFSNDFSQLSQEANKLLSLATQNPGQLIDECQQFTGDRQHAEELLDLLELRLFDMLLYKIQDNSPHLYDRSWCKNNEQMTRRFDKAILQTISSEIAKGRRMRSYNVSPRLIAENALLATQRE